MELNEFAREVHALAAEIVLTVAGYVEWQGLDFWQIVAEKMEYNKKRPRLHGNRY